MTHIMLDLETAGLCGTAGIFSIGAVRFGADFVDIPGAFHRRADIQTSYAAGLDHDLSTLKWWTERSEAARAELTGHAHLKDILEEFTVWLGPGVTAIWGNGAAFDNAVLKNAYRACGLAVPWPHWADKCYRTVSAGWPARAQRGVRHNPVDDSASQAWHMMEHGRGWLV